jgi:tetratricopeptide (TPR) repeat protein
VAERDYWAFFSYSSADRRWAERLQAAIEGYHVPAGLVGAPTPAGPAPRRLRPTFRDRSDLAAGHDLQARIDEALERSAWLIVLCSPASAASSWVDQEIRRFAAKHGRERILPIIVTGSPNDSYDSCFPPALRYGEGGAPATESGHPVAADLRPRRDGWRLARLKILAGMLGVGLDDLARRDERRRHRAMLAITVSSIAGMILAAGLAAAALLARNEARTQRAEAQDLIEAMLGDLGQRLEQKGDLDLLDGAVSRVVRYYRAQNPVALDARGRLQRARAFLTLGKIEFARGRLGPAGLAFAQALAASAKPPIPEPFRGQAIFTRAQAFYWLGDVATQEGRLGEAERDFRNYQGVAARQAALDPADETWRTEAAEADADLGVVLGVQDRPAEALVDFGNALPLVEAAARKTPDADHQIQVAQIHAAMADALDMEGRLAASRAERVAEAGIYAGILAHDPTYRDADVDRIANDLALAHLELIQGDAQAAASRDAKAADHAQLLWIRKRLDTDLESLCVIANARLSQAKLAMDDFDGAQAALDQAAPHIANLHARDPSMAVWRRYADEAALSQAAILRQRGDVEEARRTDQRVLADASPMLRPAVNSAPRWLVNEARLGFARDGARLGQIAGAQKDITAVLAELTPNEHRLEPTLLIVLNEARKAHGPSGLRFLSHTHGAPVG